MKQNPYAGLLGNPYAQMYGGPFPMKTPEQYQAELMARVQPQISQYRQMYDASQAQAKAVENSGVYYKVSSYDEMMGIQAPADGKPVMVFDENAGRLYSKRFENGQTYAVGFQLTPLGDGRKNFTDDGLGAESPIEKTGGAENSADSLAKAIDGINARLDALEAKAYDHSGNAPKKAEGPKPKGV